MGPHRRRRSEEAIERLPLDAGDWRNITGKRSRQILRHVEHTVVAHDFMALLVPQVPALGWEVAHIDPPRRASRYLIDAAAWLVGVAHGVLHGFLREPENWGRERERV